MVDVRSTGPAMAPGRGGCCVQTAGASSDLVDRSAEARGAVVHPARWVVVA